jgi:hypothetical protein
MSFTASRCLTVRSFVLDRFRKIEISEFLELSACVVPFDSGPIIQALQRKMDVLIRFQFNDRELMVARRGEDVEHGSI